MKKIYLFCSLVLLNTTAFAQCWQVVSPGSTHTVAINTDGTLWAWGFNASGQLGDGTAVEKDIPVKIGTQNIWKTVSAGGNHTLAIKTDGTLWAWGDNQWGQIGDGTFGNVRRVPIKIGTATNWAAVSAGQSFSMAIKTDGTLWAWGDNFYGQLGNGHVTAYAPTQVGTASDWESVSAGANHTVALKNDNTLWSWGLNLEGQLGDGTFTNHPAPVKIGMATDWQSIDAGYNHTLALTTNGALWAWGNNDDGQLGDGTFVGRNTPVQAGAALWKSIAAGKNNSLGIRNDGTLWAWGYIIGGVVLGEDVNRNTPTQLVTTTPLESITLGDDHAFAFGTNGTLWTWGIGTWGKLGDDTWVDKNQPQILFTAPPAGPSSQLFCEFGAVVSELSVTGTNVRWYDAATGGSVLTPTTALQDGGHYYATQTRTGCESQTRLEVTVTFKPTPVAPTGQPSYTFCTGEKLTAISVSGTGIKWYTAATGGTLLSPDLVTLTNGVHYYASQTIDGCESTQRLDVIASRNSTAAPTASQSIQTFCQPSTIADLIVTGTAVRWYADAAGGSAIPVTTPLVSGTAYYATSTVSSLESCARRKVTAIITNALAPTGETRQAFCKSGQVASLLATGTAIKWYNVPTGGVALSGFIALANGTYYATQTIGACESTERLQVQVVINPLNTPTPTGLATQVMCDQAAIGDLVVTGQNIKWYFTPTGGGPVPNQMEALETSYYATQTIDACESAGRLKVTVVTNKVNLPDLPTATPFRARIVSGGYHFSVAIMEDGTLWSWGDNINGTLGNGTRVSNLTPTMFNAETDWTFIHASNAHVVALKSNGTLWAWGANDAGQLGDGTETDRLVPTQIGTDTDWKMVSAGGSHTLALKTNGTLWSCGWNYYGQTGIVTDRGWPLIGLHQVGTATDWESVAAGGAQSLALKIDKTVWVWGKIGAGTNNGSTVQVKIPSAKPWRSIVAGEFHVLGIQEDGSLWAWGSNEYSQLGDGTDFGSQSEPTRVGDGHDWAQVSGGAAHTVALKTDGSLWGWGQNAYSQVGVPLPPWQFKSPERIGTDTDWKYVDAGFEHNFAIRKDGTIWAWGLNRGGQLGEGTRLNGLAPTRLHRTDLYTCGSGTLADVDTGGDQVIWYDAAEGGNVLNPSTAIVSGNYYYLAQSVNSTESCYRIGVRILTSQTSPSPPTGNVTQTKCLGSTLSDLVVTGTNIKWYDAPTGGNVLTTSTILVDGGHYYASQRPEGCESVARLDISVDLNGIAAPTVPSPQTFCEGATLAQLSATGSDIRWYATMDDTTPLPLSALLNNSTQYFASQKLGSCESSSRQPVSVIVNPLPAAPTGNASPIFCQASTVANLAATGTGIVWYDVPTGGTPLATTVALVDKKHYYSSQQVNGCISPQRFDVMATVTILSVPTAPLTQTFCDGATVANLVPATTGFNWYTAATGGDALAATTSLVSRQYFLARISGTCESLRRAITVNVSAAPSPTGNAEQVFCKEVTVANLVATGTNVKWFDIPTGGTPLAETVFLENGKHYYASQQPGTCPSTQRLDVTVTISITPPPNAPGSQNLCSGATLANVTADGTDLKWYAAIVGGIPLASVTALQDNQSYFVSQTVNSCESARMPVIVTLNPTPPVPTGETTQTFCHSGTVADLVVVADEVQWFDASVGGNQLSGSTMLVDETHYYAAQAGGVCTSTERLDVTVILRAPEVPTASAIQTFCGTATLADLFASGTDLTWYGTSDSQTALPTSTILEDGQRYFVTQTIDNCESARLEITTAINDIPAAPTGESFLALEENQTLADLVVTGQAITWYPSATDAINRSNALSPSQILVDNQSYFATQTLSDCESTEFLSVTVTIITSLETTNAVLTYHPNPVKNYLELSMARTIGIVSIQNTFGQVVFAGELKSAEGVIDFTGFASGIYIVRIGEGREREVVKVVKE